MTALLGVVGALRGRRRLSPMSLALLRASAPHEDSEQWRDVVLTIDTQYHRPAVNTRLRELAENGFITTQGSPRTGWITDKGRAALAKSHS